MKVIFLDFDGVLNGRRYLDTMSREVTLQTTPDLDPVCCERIERICKATGASIVISSSWREVKTYDDNLDVVRSSRPIDEIVGWLRAAGITAPVIGATSIAPMSNSDLKTRRAWQIRAWTYDCVDLGAWVVLDDWKLPELGGRLIRTSEITGITDADVERAILMLGEVRS